MRSRCSRGGHAERGADVSTGAARRQCDGDVSPVGEHPAARASSNAYAGGGVFSMPAAGGTITQIAPAELGPTDIDQSPTYVVYATDVGPVRRVPKTPQ